MRTILVGVAVVLAAAASGAVIGAQHTPAVDHQMPHQICSPHAPGSSHTAVGDHASHLANKLELTPEQRASVERISTEACAAMAKYHQQILDVLTAEQAAKLKELHGGGHGDVHSWLRKLHGGR